MNLTYKQALLTSSEKWQYIAAYHKAGMTVPHAPFHLTNFKNGCALCHYVLTTHVLTAGYEDAICRTYCPLKSCMKRGSLYQKYVDAIHKERVDCKKAYKRATAIAQRLLKAVK